MIGTAVAKVSGMSVMTPELPAQAILHDKDPWTDAVGISLEGH